MIKLFKKEVVGVALLISGYAFANHVDDYRYIRYCEVIVGKGLKASVYTTMQSNNCPQNLWNKLNVKLIKSENKASFVYLNGPRHFVFDKYVYYKTSKNLDEKYFGGIKMHKVATVKVRLIDIIKGFRPYIEHEVYRQTIWTFKAGKPVYELISPTNKVYIMQSYSDEIIKQDAKSLAKLGSTLILPKGWLFKTGILKKEESLRTNSDIAVVTQDNLKNTYQLSTKDFLS